MCVLPCTCILAQTSQRCTRIADGKCVQLTIGEAKSRCRIRRNSSGCHGTRWFYSRKHHYQNQKGVCVCTRVYTCVCVCARARARTRRRGCGKNTRCKCVVRASKRSEVHEPARRALCTSKCCTQITLATTPVHLHIKHTGAAHCEQQRKKRF